ncbi:MAG: response regulator, partial [Nitrospinota bacterium]
MKKKIFLIDDDHMICTLLKILIEDVPSLEFSSMCSSKEAVEYLKSSNAPPDLVLIDMRMPDMGGIETLTELKALPGLQKTRFSIFSTAVDKESV